MARGLITEEMILDIIKRHPEGDRFTILEVGGNMGVRTKSWT